MDNCLCKYDKNFEENFYKLKSKNKNKDKTKCKECEREFHLSCFNCDFSRNFNKSFLCFYCLMQRLFPFMRFQQILIKPFLLKRKRENYSDLIMKRINLDINLIEKYKNEKEFEFLFFSFIITNNFLLEENFNILKFPSNSIVLNDKKYNVNIKGISNCINIKDLVSNKKSGILDLKLNFTANDGNDFVLFAFIFKEITIKEVNIKDNFDFNKCKEIIKNNLNSLNGEIILSEEVTIEDPYTKMPIKIPVRSLKCSHIQCFDLITYLKVQFAKMNNKCPHCSKEIFINDLFICKFFLDVLEKVNRINKNAIEKIKRVNIFPDGNFETLKEDEDSQSNCSNEICEETLAHSNINANNLKIGKLKNNNNKAGLNIHNNNNLYDLKDSKELNITTDKSKRDKDNIQNSQGSEDVDFSNYNLL